MILRVLLLSKYLRPSTSITFPPTVFFLDSGDERNWPRSPVVLGPFDQRRLLEEYSSGRLLSVVE